MSRHIAGVITALALLPLLLGGCKPVPEEPNWAGVQNFLYQLQHADPDRIGETAFDLAVVTLATAGSSPEVIPALKDSPGGPKLILCYMSIGQSENYRWYWNPDWELNPPSWLGPPRWGLGWRPLGALLGSRLAGNHLREKRVVP